MANGVTYGINFPFRDSRRGDYLELTEFQSQEIKADLIHLLLTRKGSRYFLPQFGTRLYEFLFEPFDGLTFNAIESDIRDAIENFPGKGTSEYTAKIRIDYSTNGSTFGQSDFVIINI